MQQRQLVLGISHRVWRGVDRIGVRVGRRIGDRADQGELGGVLQRHDAGSSKISLLQNGQEFASIINAQAESALARSASAMVTAVKVTSPTQATVTYDILIGGKPALSNQTGTAVYQDGTWKVGDGSFCQLLALENGGKAPPVCSSAD